MGQQQMLLIALGVIIVGAMIVAGIYIRNVYNENDNRDELIQYLTNLGSNANAYYKKLKVNGGGNNSYLGWKVPQKLLRNDIGTIRTNVRTNRIILDGLGKVKGKNQKTNVRVRATITPDKVLINVLN